MVQNFKTSQNPAENSTSSDRETLETINRLLELHGYETHDLIHQVKNDISKKIKTLGQATNNFYM